MGTRADFYLGTNPETMRWLGSIAFDGDPRGAPESVFTATTEEEYVSAVQKILKEGEDSSTTPNMGWPWPWVDSSGSDYAYTFEGGKALVSAGRKFVSMEEYEKYSEEYESSLPKQKFPDMSSTQNVTFGPRSGLAPFIRR